MDLATFVAVASAAVALGSAIFAAQQSCAARRAIEQSRLTRLFTSFDIANQIAFNDPAVLRDVHGIPEEISDREAKNLVYLSILLDGYQNYFSDRVGRKMRLATQEMQAESTFLNRLLAVRANRERWNRMRDLFYGDFDRDFIAVIDSVIEHERKIQEAKPVS